LLTRFAPAPTGWLHLGHVLNAEFVWHQAAALKGQVLLRIEDHDRIRSRTQFESGILEDLDWLGYQPDIYPTDAYRAGRCDGRQSDRDAVYFEALEILRKQGLVYACNCSRQFAALSASGSIAPNDAKELRYPGLCRDKDHPVVDGYGWRVRIDPAVERFNDARLGPQSQAPAEQCGDVLVRDRHGNWTYQFAVTVDDWRQNIDYVVRGIDLLPSTGRQIRLARLLGRREPPTFLHHPLIMKNAHQKLSKSDGDSGVRDLRARGWSPADVKRAATGLLNL
jgi:glutamyl-tRNA synthetase/glutamyl-Q tRNA(Asp) synthetase